MRPDIVINRTIDIIDIKCPVEMNSDTFTITDERNQNDYNGLAEYLRSKGWIVSLSTFIVGAFGLWDPKNDSIVKIMGVDTKTKLNRIKYLTTTSNITSSYLLWLEHVKPQEIINTN